MTALLYGCTAEQTSPRPDGCLGNNKPRASRIADRWASSVGGAQCGLGVSGVPRGYLLSHSSDPASAHLLTVSNLSGVAYSASFSHQLCRVIDMAASTERQRIPLWLDCVCRPVVFTLCGLSLTNSTGPWTRCTCTPHAVQLNTRSPHTIGRICPPPRLPRPSCRAPRSQHRPRQCLHG